MENEKGQEEQKEEKPESQRLREPGELREKFAARETCRHGHPWTPENTRWRRRVRRGNENLAPERDCLICKRESERKRRIKVKERLLAEQRASQGDRDQEAARPEETEGQQGAQSIPGESTDQ